MVLQYRLFSINLVILLDDQRGIWTREEFGVVTPSSYSVAFVISIRSFFVSGGACPFQLAVLVPSIPLSCVKV